MTQNLRTFIFITTVEKLNREKKVPSARAPPAGPSGVAPGGGPLTSRVGAGVAAHRNRNALFGPSVLSFDTASTFYFTR